MPRPQPMLCAEVLEEAEEQAEVCEDYSVTASGNAFSFGKAGLSISASGIQVSSASPAYAQRCLPPTAAVSSVDELDLAHAETVGEGSSGKVLVCTHIPTGEKLAVKQIPTEEDHARKEILKELEALHSDRSRFIVNFYGAFWHENSILITLECMDASLLDVLRLVGPISEESTCAIAWYVSQGLIYLHSERRKIHRDIKPSNLLINSSGVVKITDFGVSSGALRESMHEQADTFVGTVVYMSPERLAGQSHSYSADIWSLALVLIELATGRHPFATQGTNYWEMLQRSQQDAAVDFSRFGISEVMQSFCAPCLAKHPSDRPSAVCLMAHRWLLPLTDERAVRVVQPLGQRVAEEKRAKQQECDQHHPSQAEQAKTTIDAAFADLGL
eukprot:TRINITY_DN5138_c0_g3_i1.p1 TRINITY_DN5138_c0_g3~~TRINITY_DN5138_c0_g3_i1.p1  ORF type:complete len:428 (+),score=118.20 TRINITY_DN5138_c0_g3_i1:125-1285(+)